VIVEVLNLVSRLTFSLGMPIKGCATFCGSAEGPCPRNFNEFAATIEAMIRFRHDHTPKNGDAH